MRMAKTQRCLPAIGHILLLGCADIAFWNRLRHVAPSLVAREQGLWVDPLHSVPGKPPSGFLDRNPTASFCCFMPLLQRQVETNRKAQRRSTPRCAQYPTLFLSLFLSTV